MEAFVGTYELGHVFVFSQFMLFQLTLAAAEAFMFRNACDQFDAGILEHYMHVFYEELKQCWCLAFEVQTQSISMDSVAGKTIWILFELFVGHR